MSDRSDEEEKTEEEEGEKLGDENRREEEESITMQTQNITGLATNGSFLIEDKIDMTFLQECKVKEEERGKIQKAFEEKDYDIIVGPCCNNTNKNKCRSRMCKQQRKGRNHHTKTPDESI